eukprot:8097882-Pyramimonas_sp.AAC.1
MVIWRAPQQPHLPTNLRSPCAARAYTANHSHDPARPLPGRKCQRHWRATPEPEQPPVLSEGPELSARPQQRTLRPASLQRHARHQRAPTP